MEACQKMHGGAWTKQRIELLKALWAEGRPAADIAAELRISPAAVLGKVFRLRLKPKRARGVAGSPQRRKRGRRYAAKPAAPVAPAQAPDKTARGKTLFELTNDSCRWPIGRPGTPGFHFCGAAGADLESGRPYCERHAKRAYLKPRKRADRTARAPGSSSVAPIDAPPLVPGERWQRIILAMLGRRA
jgi:GcrA cell cycle regulator